jgi:pyridoxamine 5'-phosphate oxidase
METWPDPLARFQDVFTRARVSAPAGFDATAVTLATADSACRPSARVVLLKNADDRGFVFYTNLTSRKATDLGANPNAALCFYWPWIGEQVRVEGIVEQVSDAYSDTYFASRPRESQLGAWASRQSRPRATHELLHERFHELSAEYADKIVPRPRWWGGYRLVPARIEFWRQGEHRLHHRELYSRADGGWAVAILDP